MVQNERSWSALSRDPSDRKLPPPLGPVGCQIMMSGTFDGVGKNNSRPVTDCQEGCGLLPGIKRSNRSNAEGSQFLIRTHRLLRLRLDVSDTPHGTTWS